MGSFKNDIENELLDHILGTGSYTMPTVVHASLQITVAASDSVTGTELSGNGYTRSADIAFDGAALNTAQNTSNVDIGPNVTDDWGTVISMALHDHATAGAQLMWDDSFSVAFAVGDTARFPADTGIVVTLD